MTPADDPIPRRSYHHGDLLRGAMDQALRRVAEDGPHAISLRGIARSLGVSHRALYRHFADKRGLLAAIVAEGYGLLADAIEAELARVGEASVLERLRGIVRAYVGFGHGHPAHYVVMAGRPLEENGRDQAPEAAMERALAVVRTVFDEGMERGELAEHDSFVATLTLWSALHGFTHLAIMGRWNVRPAKIGEWGRQALEPTLAGLLASLAPEA